MSNRKVFRSNTLKVLLAFFVSGTGSGVCFAWLITRKSIYDFWFTIEGMWVFTTWKFWFLTDLLFLLGLASAYIVSRLQGWLFLSAIPWYRLLLAITMIAAVPALGGLPIIAPLLVQFFLIRVIVALFLSLALFALTQQWYKQVVALIVIVCLVTTLVASIPDAMIGPLSYEWFEALQFCIGSSLLTALSGYWLVKSTPTVYG